jgi:hypothetical protein
MRRIALEVVHDYIYPFSDPKLPDQEARAREALVEFFGFA